MVLKAMKNSLKKLSEKTFLSKKNCMKKQNQKKKFSGNFPKFRSSDIF